MTDAPESVWVLSSMAEHRFADDPAYHGLPAAIHMQVAVPGLHGLVRIERRGRDFVVTDNPLRGHGVPDADLLAAALQNHPQVLETMTTATGWRSSVSIFGEIARALWGR